MKQIYILIILTLVRATQSYLFSQEPNINNNIEYLIESRGYLSNGQGAFWQRANQNGEVPNFQQVASWSKISIQKQYVSDSTGKGKWLDWGMGSTGIGVLSQQSQIFLSQLYGQLKVWKLDLSAGKRYETLGIVDNELSSGSFSFSNNALPIPKIQLSSLGFVEIPFTKKILALKFNYSDGYIGNTEANPFGQYVSIKDTYLHQKTLYGRVGKPHWKLKLYGGFSHQVMWGGEYQVWPTDFNLTQKERYWAIVSGGTWLGSRIGNHVATLDLGCSYQLPQMNLMLYRQNLVEDGSLYRGLSNIADGLNGVMVKFKKRNSSRITIEKAVFELLYTGSQGGKEVNFSAGLFGPDNYFNHYVYLNGWSYRGNTIGTPFIVPKENTRESLRANSQGDFTNNNRILLIHTGVTGKIFQKYNILTKLSFSKNNGTYSTPFIKSIYQLSGLIEVKTRQEWLGCDLVSSLGIDAGQLLPNQVSFYFGLRKSGMF
ncbi:MAG: capsule assembly Wzi family protein [Spirosomaceae bacterium]|nr:capsule assembly Wzi family protein [Spirosomataceae bacterium]